MLRCPIAVCRYGILNGENVSQSVGVHFREHHGEPGQRFRAHYLNNKGEECLYPRPSPETEEGAKPAPEGIKVPGTQKESQQNKEKKTARPRVSWTKQGSAKCTQPTIRQHMLRNQDTQESLESSQRSLQPAPEEIRGETSTEKACRQDLGKEYEHVPTSDPWDGDTQDPGGGDQTNTLAGTPPDTVGGLAPRQQEQYAVTGGTTISQEWDPLPENEQFLQSILQEFPEGGRTGEQATTRPRGG